jgi:hypothetical protein
MADKLININRPKRDEIKQKIRDKCSEATLLKLVDQNPDDFLTFVSAITEKQFGEILSKRFSGNFTRFISPNKVAMMYTLLKLNQIDVDLNYIEAIFPRVSEFQGIVGNLGTMKTNSLVIHRHVDPDTGLETVTGTNKGHTIPTHIRLPHRGRAVLYENEWNIIE